MAVAAEGPVTSRSECRATTSPKSEISEDLGSHYRDGPPGRNAVRPGSTVAANATRPCHGPPAARQCERDRPPPAADRARPGDPRGPAYTPLITRRRRAGGSSACGGEGVRGGRRITSRRADRSAAQGVSASDSVQRPSSAAAAAAPRPSRAQPDPAHARTLRRPAKG